MFAIRLRGENWAVVSELDGAIVSSAPTRFDALDELRKLYDVDPTLARLDWGEQRILSAAALRWRNRYQLGGTLATITAAVRLADPTPLDGYEVAWLDDLARSEPEHRHLSRDLAGRAWPMTAAVTRSRLRRLSHELATIDQRLGDRLYAGAVTAMRDALRRAGVKATVRAKNRGKQATALLAAQGMTRSVLAAISVSPDELLDRAFASLRTDSQEWMIDANRKRARAVAVAFDQDPDDFEEDDSGDRRAEEAAALLALLLLRRARNALGDSAVAGPDLDIKLVAPFADIRTAMRVRDGARVIQTIAQGPNRTPEADAGVSVVDPPPGSGAIDELLGKASDGMTFTRFYTWNWAYYGEPGKPFPPHQDLDGATFDDETRSEVLAKDAAEYPYGTTEWDYGDHEGCLCFCTIEYEPVEG